jgi:tetratricopeptide (TPR) repeat protein
MKIAWPLLLVGAVSHPLWAAQQDEAAAALRSGQYDQAIELFQAEVARRPAPAAVRGLVDALSEVGRYEEAESVAARHADALAPELWNALGEVQLARGKLREAEASFSKAMQDRASDSLTAKLNRAIIYHRRGAVRRANAEFDSFIDAYNAGTRLTSADLTAVATAVAYLGKVNWGLTQDALRAYDEAVAADADNLGARVRVGELFLDAYNSTDAVATFEEVLDINPRHPLALLGKARSRRFDGSDEALDLTKLSLEANPNLVPARTFLGALYLELENYGAAAREARRALDVDSNALEALSVLAASQFFSGEQVQFEETRRQVLALNPRYADLYNTLAELSARIRRYRDAVSFARQAVALDSTSWRGFALLGRNQLRLGAMTDGAKNLETAFAGDPHDVWTKNTLDLLDTLQHYPETTSPRFRFFIDGSESQLLAIYAHELAEEAYDRLSARYQYHPPIPIRVEVYSSHADFSVRTVGLVGLGALGVSFGPVVAMDSPSARDKGHFNWGSTLWHEIAHTFHLGMSDHRVPRWFTEGLAVLEERRARPGWGDDVSPGFLLAYLQDRLVPLDDLNSGFTRPAYPQQVIFSYYQASLVCELIEQEHGVAAIRALLHGYAEGKTTVELFQSVLGTSPRAFGRVFDTYLKRRFAEPLAALMVEVRERSDGGVSRQAMALRAKADRNDFVAHLATGHSLFRERQYAAAVPYLERAKELFPEYAGPDSPYWYLAQIAKERGDVRRAADELSTLTAINERHYQAVMELADLRETLNDRVGTTAALANALYMYPLDMALHERLATLYGDREQWPDAVRERKAVLALRPVDQAEAAYQLALAHFNGGEIDDARRAVLRALEQAPNFEKAQELLLSIHAARRGTNP